MIEVVRCSRHLLAVLLSKGLTVICMTALMLLVAFQPIAVAAEMVDGAQVFELHCAGCHLNGGNIVRRGKNLKQKALTRNDVDSLEKIIALVANGKGNMSAYRDRLSPQQIEDVSAYVLKQAASDWR